MAEEKPDGVRKIFNFLAMGTLAVLSCVAAHFIIDATGLGAVFYPLAHVFGDATGLSGMGEWMADLTNFDAGHMAHAGHNHG